jgi:putative ABC transport system permease protein
MNPSVPDIPTLNLALALAPLSLVLWVLWRWRLPLGNPLYSHARMLIQLLLIGYVLTFLFTADSPPLILAVLGVMLTAAAWIALQPLQSRDRQRFGRALLAIGAVGLAQLALVTQVVLAVEPWYAPRFVIPLAGMIFSNAMNAVSLAAERFEAELRDGKPADGARRTALNAALIPQINTLLAVGLVALPGMMTGQILSGIEPLIAARYQIVIMATVFSGAALAAAAYLMQPPRHARL